MFALLFALFICLVCFRFSVEFCVYGAFVLFCNMLCVVFLGCVVCGDFA